MRTEHAPVVHRWSTANVHASQRAAYFAAACDSALIPLQLTVAEPKSFQAVIEAADLGPLLVMRHAGAPHACNSGPREIARQREHSFNIVLGRSAPWQLEHRGRLVVPADSSVLTDSRVPMHIEQFAAYECVNIKLPEPWLRQWVSSPGAVVGREVIASSRWGRVLSNFLRAMTPEFVANAPVPARVLSDQLGALLALVESDLAGHVKARKPDRRLVDRIGESIRDHCIDANATAPAIAAALGISVRTLHRTLAADDRTFGAALISARLETAVRMLESPAFRRLTTAEIARRAGFSGASHFARVFRQRTGVSPARFRREILNDNKGPQV